MHQRQTNSFSKIFLTFLIFSFGINSIGFTQSEGPLLTETLTPVKSTDTPHDVTSAPEIQAAQDSQTFLENTLELTAPGEDKKTPLPEPALEEPNDEFERIEVGRTHPGAREYPDATVVRFGPHWEFVLTVLDQQLGPLVCLLARSRARTISPERQIEGQ